MKTFTLLIVLALGVSSQAQNIIMKDGRIIVAKALKRQGDQIIATQEVQIAPDKPPSTGEFGYKIAEIAKLDFPEPGALKAAADLITQGKGDAALAQLDPVVRYYEGFRDAPGSWWADAAMLRVNALNSIGKEKEAEPIIDQLARFATDPEIVRAARVLQAASQARHGNFTQALPVFEAAMKEATREDTLATAALYKGQCHLALKQYDKAILSFLTVPVFYPDQHVLLPAAMLGAGRAHFAVEDFDRAKKKLNELVTAYPATSEAAAAKEELDKIAKREKALEVPK